MDNRLVDPSLLFSDLKWSYAGVGTTGFVLSLSWLSNVTAGHTKRITTNAIMLSAYCIGNSAGPFMWQAKYKPRCDIYLTSEKQGAELVTETIFPGL